MRDEIILSGPGYVVFHCILEGHKFINNVSYCHVLPSQNKVSLSHTVWMRDRGSQKSFHDRKKHRLMIIYMKGISGLPVTYNQRVLVLDPFLPLVLGPVIITPYNVRHA